MPSRRSLLLLPAVAVFLAGAVAACGTGAPTQVRTVTQTVTVTRSDAPSAAEPSPSASAEFVADEDAFYEQAIKLDRSLADMTRGTVTGYGWNLCTLETMADMDDPMYKNMLGPAKARGTLKAAHTYLCPENG